MSAAWSRFLAAPLALALGALGLLAPSASAYWSGTGNGGGSALVTTLGTPLLSASVEGEAVKLSWSAAATPEAQSSVLYYVKRDGVGAGGNCPTEAAPASVLTCTDGGVA